MMHSGGKGEIEEEFKHKEIKLDQDRVIISTQLLNSKDYISICVQLIVDDIEMMTLADDD